MIHKNCHKIFLLTAFYLVIMNAVFSQSTLSGKVIDTNTGKAIAGANVALTDNQGAITDENGLFSIENVGMGDYSVKVSFVGYSTVFKNVSIKDHQEISLDFELSPSGVDLDEIVISATKTENYARDIPARISLLSGKELQALPVQTTDDYLDYLPGVNVNKTFGIFSSKSTVTMRGLDGKEQGRVLVLLDGIPVNKADGGSVNWNLINTGNIKKIEVVKGAGSSLWGGNAMGGTINILTQKPKQKLAGSAGLKYGTYNTWGGKLSLTGRLSDSLTQGFYWGIDGYYLQSDGYITQSKADQKANPYIVKSNMKEIIGGARIGYDFGKNNFAEINFIYFNDRQGTGEKVYQPEGNTTDHDTYHIRGTYHGEKKSATWNVNLFYLNEAYKKVNEFMKDDYTLYDVLSKRVDLGGLFSWSDRLGRHHRLTAGLDLKQGSVDAEDVYYTSTDIVYNRGKMNTLGVFAQDELSYLDDRFKIIAGLRFDNARYYNGAFYIEAPSGETSFMLQYQDDAQETDTWTALSPKLSVQYRFNPDYRIYANYGRGFRPSVLDDLCRSGRVRGGFKVANTKLDPEYLDNIEVGADAGFLKKMRGTASLYYSYGKDFIYYVNSGDSIDMGFGDRPIYIPSNIAGVEIYGIELELTYDLMPSLTMSANYAYAHSQIKEYDPSTSGNNIDLTDKYLIDVPANTISFMATYRNRIVNACIAGKYTGKRWVNDTNQYDDIVGSAQYPAYTTIDARLWKDFKHFYLVLNVQNIFDVSYFDSKGAVCPGRFITLEGGVKL